MDHTQWWVWCLLLLLLLLLWVMACTIQPMACGHLIREQRDLLGHLPTYPLQLCSEEIMPCCKSLPFLPSPPPGVIKTKNNRAWQAMTAHNKHRACWEPVFCTTA